MGEAAGRTVLITRSAEDCEAWAADLSRRGARPLVFPCIGCEPIRDAGTARSLREGLRGADWLALTSARGAEAVAALAAELLPLRLPIAVVGDKTAAAARELLGRVDLVAAGGTARSLAGDLAARWRRDRSAPLRGFSPRAPAAPARGQRDGDARLRLPAPRAPTMPLIPGGRQDGDAPLRLLVAGAERGRRDIEEELAATDAEVTCVAVYRTVPAPAQEPLEDLAALGVDTIFLASPSAVAGLLARARVPDGAAVITIGPTTSEAARARGLRVAGEAAGRGLQAMIEAIP
jgi:uroporphyrinogen-III synthase